MDTYREVVAPDFAEDIQLALPAGAIQRSWRIPGEDFLKVALA